MEDNNDRLKMSLDEIVKFDRKTLKSTSSGFKRNVKGKKNASVNGSASVKRAGKGKKGTFVKKNPYSRPEVEESVDFWQHDMFNRNGASNAIKDGRSLISGTKVLVSNLHVNVTDDDMKELFSPFGPLKKANVHFSSSGVSLGTAEIIFQNRNDAIRSIQKFQNMALDGKPMVLSVVQDQPAVSIGNRLKSTKNSINQNRNQGNKSVNRNKVNNNNKKRVTNNGGRNNENPRKSNVATSQVQLDADLDVYMA